MGTYGLDWRETDSYGIYLAWNATEGPKMLERLCSLKENVV